MKPLRLWRERSVVGLLDLTMRAILPQTRRSADSGPAERVQSGNAKTSAPKNTDGPAMPPKKTWLWFLLILFTNYSLVQIIMPSAEETLTVPYSVFKEGDRKGKCPSDL